MEFTLAPMSTLIRWVTIALLLLPVALLGMGLATSAGPLLVPIAGVMGLIYLWIWLWWRPKTFHATEPTLQLRFPWREIAIPRGAMISARQVTGSKLRQELGLTVRLGAGGVWGAFGWLWSRRRGFLEIYVSRQDGFVLIERADAIPLLVTPSEPDQFIAALALDR